MDFNAPTQRVNAKAFFSLMTSRKNLFRADDKSNGIRGLVDPELGVHYVISEQQLFDERQLKHLSKEVLQNASGT